MAADPREKHEKEFKIRLKAAQNYRKEDKEELARAELIQALAYAEKHLGTNSEEVIEACLKLASLHASIQEPGEELRLLQRVLHIREAVGGVEGIVDSLQDLAFCHGSYGRTEEAEKLYRRAIGLCVESVQAHHAPLRLTLLYLGDFLIEQDRFAEAVEPLERGLRVCARSTSYPSTCGSRTACALGVALLRVDRTEEGEALLDQALPLVSHRSQPSSTPLRRALHIYANHLQRTDRFAKADLIYGEALYHFGNSNRAHPVNHAHLLQAAASNDVRLDRKDRAERRLQLGLRLLRDKVEPHHVRVLSLQQDLSNLFIPALRYADAEAILTEMVQATAHADFTDLRARERYLNNLGFVQVHLEEFPKAEANLRRALVTAGDDHGCYIIKNLGLMYQKMGYTTEAIREYEKALPLFVKEFGEAHTVAAFIRDALKELKA